MVKFIYLKLYVIGKLVITYRSSSSSKLISSSKFHHHHQKVDNKTHNLTRTKTIKTQLSFPIQFGIELPEENPASNASNQAELPVDLSERIHEALLGIEIVEGYLVCPETNYKFPITNSTPNMLINEDIVQNKS